MPSMRTFLAALDMTANCGCTTNLDCRHDASLDEVHVPGIGHAPRFAMAA